MVRKWLGLTPVDQDDRPRKQWQSDLCSGRLVAGKVLIPGGRPVVCSPYLVCGVGLDTGNKEILTASGRHAERHRFEWLAGGD